MVALLRGINVGGAGVLPMADLRAIATEVGFEDVRTYIQSGNLVFHAADRSAGDVAEQLRAALATAASLEVEVIVRTRAELARIVARHPFEDRCADPGHLHVTFLSTPAAAVIEGMDLPAHAPEEVVAVDRELYLHLPAGMGRSKLAAALTRRLGRVGTTRSWKTITKLLDLAT